MTDRHVAGGACLLVAGWLVSPAASQPICEGYGPQSPRDIASRAGTNQQRFQSLSPGGLNLCNIHVHRHAEHKGPGFTVSAGDGPDGGYRCNDSAAPASAAPVAPTHDHGAFEGVAPGDTIEVHWVYTSCDVRPGAGLDACKSERCVNPQLLVQAQVFRLVDGPTGLDIEPLVRESANGDELSALLDGFGKPVIYAGSTTGADYSEATCSPLQVTWIVRPTCAQLDIGSLHAWARSADVFGTDQREAHGVRQLVTAPELLAQID